MEFLSSLSDLLGIDDRKVVDFEVPEWNISVKLRAMTGNDRDAFEAHVTNGGKEGTVNVLGMRAKLVGACLVDADGNRLVPDGSEEKLGEKSAAALDRLFTKCMSLNGMTEEDEKKLVENFEDAPSEDSTTA